MILLQFSSAQGPEECCIAVENAFACFVKEAALLKVNTELLESCPSKQGLKSVLIALDGIHAEKMAERWSGTIQWKCQSPLRPRHKRKKCDDVYTNTTFRKQ